MRVLIFANGEELKDSVSVYCGVVSKGLYASMTASCATRRLSQEPKCPRKYLSKFCARLNIVDMDKVRSLKAKGLGIRQVAKILGVSTNIIQKSCAGRRQNTQD